MKRTHYGPYLYNPDNTYLTISADLSSTDPTDQRPGRKQVSPQKASKPLKGRDFLQKISAWLYFQLQYHVIAIFAVSALLILWLLLSSGAFRLLLK